jgi:hypothetical protein
MLRFKPVPPIGYFYLPTTQPGVVEPKAIAVYPAEAVERGDALRRAIFQRGLLWPDVVKALNLPSVATLRTLVEGRVEFDLEAAVRLLPDRA